MMKTFAVLLLAALAGPIGACARPPATLPAAAPPAESEAITETIAGPSATTAGGLLGGDGQPPPADAVFFPDVFAEDDGSLTFGLRMLPRHYVYKRSLTLRSLTDGTRVTEVLLPAGRLVEDEWFGAQEVYFDDVLASASLEHDGPRPTRVDVELAYQGCLEDELCYLPVTRTFSIELAHEVK